MVVLTQHSTWLQHILGPMSAVIVGKHEGSRRLVDAIHAAANATKEAERLAHGQNTAA
jgi:hypothetical protein